MSAAAHCQQIDTSKVIRVYDSIPKLEKKKVYAKPRTATILSAILPGAGQVYNRKIWKVPIIYAGLGGFGYWFSRENSSYNFYAKNLKYEYDDNPETLNTSGFTGDALAVYKAEHKRYRDLSFIGLTVIYVLNIIDANVDAHLRTFDVSDDLSLRIEPWPGSVYGYGEKNNLNIGISFKLRIR
jgi:hypothetical protein